MKRAISAAAMIAIGLWSASVFAQGRNFGGTWTIDQEKTLAAAAAALETAAGGAVVARSGGGGGVGGGGARSGGGGGTAAVGAGGGGFAAVSGTGAAPGMRSGGGGGGRGGGTAGPMTVMLDANTFSFGSGSTSNVYRLDGSPTVTETPAGRSTSKAGWKDDKLVIDITLESPNGPVNSSIVWYLEGDSLVRENHSNVNGQDVVRKTYYKRT
jgi:hypothetical protein